MKDRPRDEELNQQMTENANVSNYVSQIVRKEVGQEEERQHLSMTQTSSTIVGQDRKNKQQWSHHPENEARIHHNMTNLSVISALVKPDEPAPHGRNNGTASNHERINYQCKTDNKMIDDDNQRDAMLCTSRCYDQSETNVMPVYR